MTAEDPASAGAAGIQDEIKPEEVIPEADILLKDIVVLPPRQKNAKGSAEHYCRLPRLRPSEPVLSLRTALAEVVGWAHITRYRFQIVDKPTLSKRVAMPTVSPFVGWDAVIVPTESSNNASNSINLGEYDTFAPLVDGGWHNKDTALEVVLERYDVGGVREHVVRLRSLMSGNIPAVTSLVDGGVEPVEEESSEEEEQKGSDQTPATDAKKDKKPLPPLENHMESLTQVLTDKQGRMNLKEFFSRTNGEDLADSASPTQRQNSNRKKRRGKGKAKINSNGDNLPSEAKSLAANMEDWNEIDSEMHVPFTIRYGGFHPPPSNRRLMGDLAYLEFAPDDLSECLHITATPTGFYVSNSSGQGRQAVFDPTPRKEPCFSHELLDCLLQAHSSFRQSWEAALLAASKRSALMRTLNKGESNGILRLATRCEFGGFKDAKVARNVCAKALDGAVFYPLWLAPKPDETKYSDANGKSWSRHHLHEYNTGLAEEDLAQTFGVDLRNGSSRDWNEEIQAAREMPTGTLVERLDRAKLLHKILAEFGEAALQGVHAIADGQVVAMNPVEAYRTQVFLHNNIFFSRAVDSGPETFKIHQGDGAARKAANRDIQCVSTLNRSEKVGICTLGTVLIDYLGVRYICQSVLPGILSGEKCHSVLFGSVDTGIALSWDKQFHQHLNENIAQPMMLASRPIYRHPFTDERVEELEKAKSLNPLYLEFDKKRLENAGDVSKDEIMNTSVPVEAKGIRGSDGRNYVIDFGHLTPRDANWVPKAQGGTGRLDDSLQKTKIIPDELDDDEWTVHVLRPELLSSFTESRLSRFVADKKAALEKAKAPDAKETKENGPADPTEEATADKENEEAAKKAVVSKAEIDEFVSTLRLNVNVFIPHLRGFHPENESVNRKLIADDEAKAREVAEYLWDTVLPRVTKSIRDGSAQQIPTDGIALTEHIHRSGVNCRYLGRLAELAALEESKDVETEAKLQAGTARLLERRCMPKCWLELLECEMVARSAKHVLDQYLTENESVASSNPALTVASFLSAVVSDRLKSEQNDGEKSPSQDGPDEDELLALTIRDVGILSEGGNGIRGRTDVWRDIENDVGRRFRYSLTLFNSKTKADRAFYTPLLRRLCQRLGVRLVAKNYDVGGRCRCGGDSTTTGRMIESYPISSLDIIGVLPLMKHAAAHETGFKACQLGNLLTAVPPLQVSMRDARTALERAHIQTQSRALGRGLELAHEALNLYNQVTDYPAHPGVIESMELLATIFFEAGEFQSAIINASKALTLSVQCHGFDSAGVLSMNLLLFQMHYTARNTDKAIKHLHAAIYLLELMAGPRHEDHFSYYQKLGTVYSNVDYKGVYMTQAREYYQEAHNRECNDRIMRGILAKSYAKVLASCKDYKPALQVEKEAYKVFSMFMGKDNLMTKESDAELQRLTKLAVSHGATSATDSAKIKEEEARAEAMAASLAAEEESNTKKATKKKKKSKK